MEPAVAAVLEGIAPGQRAALVDLRNLILETAAETPQVGTLVETLKWGEPAYLPARARVGTTLRINALKGSTDGYAMFVNCKTRLIGMYSDLYPGVFRFEGERAVLFSTRSTPPREPVKHCIALALTYHLAKARG